MQIDSSASITPSESRSASEWAITVRMPSSLHARMMRTAISPRLAIRSLSNMGVGIWDLGIGIWELGFGEPLGQGGPKGIQLSAQGCCVFAELRSLFRRHIPKTRGDFDLCLQF